MLELAMNANITFVKGKTGWIVFDPLVTKEVVQAAWKLFQEHVGEGLPVSAVIYSHTHGDHWGGVRGIVDEGEAKRNDEEFAYVGAWEYAGADKTPILNKEPLVNQEMHEDFLSTVATSVEPVKQRQAIDKNPVIHG